VNPLTMNETMGPRLQANLAAKLARSPSLSSGDNPNPYLRARVRNLAFKAVGMSLNLTMM